MLKADFSQLTADIFKKTMLKNYIKIAFRNLLRNKSFSVINIAGLAIGISTCLLLMLYVENELSYDRFNKKADQMVRVIFRGSAGGGQMNEATVMPPAAKILKNDFPEVLESTRLRLGGSPRFTYQDKVFKGDQFAFVDSNFLEVFTLPLTEGNSETALVKPNTAVISAKMAAKFFGNADPIGKVLVNKDYNTSYLITGVLGEIPENSHFHFELFVSMAGNQDAKEDSWLTSGFYTYLVLPKGYDYKKLESKLSQTVDKYMSPQLKKAMGLTLTEYRKKGDDLGLYLQPLTDIHLRSNLTSEIEASGDIKYVYIFSVISVFMLIIACINFMNLSTAGASKRAKEIGVRKVLGSAKKHLVFQFLTESVLVALVALTLAIGLVAAAIPVFNQLAGKNLGLHFVQYIWFVPGLLFFGVVVGLLAGIYPAFFISSFKPIEVLKGKLTTGNKTLGLRSGLVVFQFLVSIVLIFSTTVVYKQLSYMLNKKVGYDKDQLVVLPETYLLGNNEHNFYNELLQDSRIASASISGFLPAGQTNSNNFIVYPDEQSSTIVKTLGYGVDCNYLPTLGMTIVQGRNFSKDLPTDSSSVILNETAARALNWGKNPLGHTITRPDNLGNKVTYKVIGVVKDFHFKSLRERISPLVMMLGNNGGNVILRIKTTNSANLLSSIKAKWDAYQTGTPFVYSFMNERFKNTYEAEIKIGKILAVFSGLTIFVASLGLFGLAMFTARQRTKEIGIRKVLGASILGITALLSKDFLKLVLIALLIASPLAWYFMHAWLQNFEYRTEIQWWVFALTGILAVLIAFITISFQTIKAALMNPVKSLRTE